MDISVGATLTGGTTKALTPSGLYAGGKAGFTTPDHTRISPRTVDFIVSQPKQQGTDPGVARSALKIAFANRTVEEGCCTVQPGTVIIDVNVRWPLSQPEEIVDDAIAYLQAIVFEPGFIASIKDGVLPTA